MYTYLGMIFNKYFATIIKKLYYKLICSIKKTRNDFDRKLGYPFAKNSKKFDDLTPSIVDDATSYIESLHWALTNSNINNIALTGPYGSGKSTILKTLKHNHPEYNYLNISLATFEEEIYEIGDKKTKDIDPAVVDIKKRREDLNQKIELSILQQMLYLEKSEKLPNSRFKRIKNLKAHSLFTLAIIWFIVGFSFIFLFKYEYLKNISFLKNLSDEKKGNIELISIISLTLGSLYILRNFIKSLYQFKFQKINSKGEVELNREVDDSSILNRNLDEIIYFFEKTNFNVVIIEDLDRFKEPEIFTKLREINLLLNNSKQINRHITFIYALKDDMFKDGNRTKFFDFIVPVIPIINPSNSYDLLYEKLKDEEIKGKKISEALLDDISLYIDDMRLLKNIVNEFKIYKEKLSKIELDPNRLFCFVIYKNKYPSDFAKLHFNKGMIYEVFNKDEQLMKQNISANLHTNIKTLKTKIDQIEEFEIESIENLRKLYILKIIENLPSERKIGTLNFDEKIIYNNVEELITDEIFNKIIEERTIGYSYLEYNPSYRRWDEYMDSLSFDKIEEKFNDDLSYEEKESLITDKNYNKIDEYKVEISNNEHRIKEINGLNLSELLNYETSIIDLNEKIIKEDILVYFLRNGLIDKNYWFYISLFHATENGLSQNDQNYILGIRNRKPKETDYKLNNISRVLTKISKDFEREEILNIDLLEYLFENNLSKELNLFAALFTHRTDRTTNFINLYIVEGKYLIKFFKLISSKFEDLWGYIESQVIFPEEIKDNILKQILIEKNSDLIKKLNKNNILTDSISGKDNFLNLFKDNQNDNKIITKHLIDLNVKFKHPLKAKDNSNLFSEIYENDLYELNKEMIEFILKEKSGLSEKKTSELNSAHFTTISDSKCENLKVYILNNIDKYISNISLKIDTNTKEREDILLELLNNKDISNDNIESIIDKEETKISNILEVTNTKYWIDLLINSKIEIKWENIINYYNQYKFDEFIIDFLNNLEDAEVLFKQKINDTKFDSETQKNFIASFLKEDKIANSTYNLFLKNITLKFSKLTLDDISDSKIKMLIENKIIMLNTDFFESVYRENIENQVLLIEYNFEEYLKKKKEIPLEIEHYESLLLSKKLLITNKLDLINDLDSTDLESNTKLCNTISDILTPSKKISIDYPFLKALFENSTNTKNNIFLFNIYFDLFKSDITKLDFILSKLGTPYSKIIDKWTEIKIPINTQNLSFVDNLNKANYYNLSKSKTEGTNIKITTRRK